MIVCRRATPRGCAYLTGVPMNSFQTFLSSKGARRRNLMRANTSSSLFCTGVPVRHNRRSATRSHDARHPTVLVSLIELVDRQTLSVTHLTRQCNYSLCLV